MGNMNSNRQCNSAEPQSVLKTDQAIKDDSMSIVSLSCREIDGNYCTQLVSIEMLSEILKKTSYKYGEQGITSNIFVSRVFPHYVDLGHSVFQLLRSHGNIVTKYLNTMDFRQQCEWFLGIMDDVKIIECYIKMYAEDENREVISKDGVTRLLLACYAISMEQSGNNTFCSFINHILTSITKSIFFNNDSLTIGFVCRWFEQNLPRIVLLLHKYCVNTLSTAYRGLEKVGINRKAKEEPRNIFPDSYIDGISVLMPKSLVWLLASALSPLYSKQYTVASSNGNKATTAQMLRGKLCVLSSHWTLLYNSNEHGIGANRFMHHVLGYRGPTIILLLTKDEQKYCIAAPDEWKENHFFTGKEGSCVMQMLPKFTILENKSNILYLNMSIRGYPKGLRAGSDPRNPIVSVDEHFESIKYKGITTALLSVEVWGCGDKTSREIQLDIIQWQMKEVERQRKVKLTAADWIDHPDRYLLELGGRQNYNN